MKTINGIQLTIQFLGLSLCVCGCAHYTEGTDFGKSEISQIVKGKTTSSDLMNILGTPYSKNPVADGGEQWFYYCSHYSEYVPWAAAAEPNAQPIISNGIIQQGQQNLTILLNKDKVVVDFTLDKGPTNK
jgi:outer membrane protein assembly factor BamE (lipoprotein component of BamABCDE complex)